MSENYPESFARFTADTHDNKMEVLKDDGVYRHLLFCAPDYGYFWFEIVTFPGSLVINGDMGAFTFSRIDDMFEFFGSGNDINPHYWSQKISGNTSFKEFSQKVFTKQVTEAYNDAKDDFTEDEQTEFWRAVQDEILAYADSEAEAKDALADFNFRFVEFSDTWEWDFTEYTQWFLWNLHAIRHAITAYDASKSQTRGRGSHRSSAHCRPRAVAYLIDTNTRSTMFGKSNGDSTATGYAYCESVSASALSPHHIRKLTDVGLKLGGGVDTPTLCGKDIHITNGWDTSPVEATDDVYAMSAPREGMNDASWRACRPCAVAYLIDTERDAK